MARDRGIPAKGKKSLPTAAVAGGPTAEAAGGGRFFCCYLLRSLCPRRKSATYIGYTVNPRRRIRQHNGEIRCGAWRTKRGRPWEMVLCIHGFPSNVAALQFEWAWQHPTESLVVRKAAAAGFKSLGGIGNKVKLAYTMLNLPSWEKLNLTVNFFSTKNTKFITGCPALPSHMNTVVSPMEDLPCYDEGLSSEDHKPESSPVRSDEGSSDHDLQPVELETRIAGCESDTDEFAPMEWSGFLGATQLDESKESQSSEPQASDEQTGIAGRDVEYPMDDFSYIKSIPMHQTFGSSITLPRCSLRSRSHGIAGRSVGEDSPVLISGVESHESDVVDLVTPINRFARGCSKMASICPKIIDLTSSPVVIQL